MKQGKKAKPCTSRHWWTSVTPRIGVGTKISKTQRPSCSPRWYCKRWFSFVCGFYWARIINITDDSTKSHGHYIKASRMRRTSSRRSIRLYSGQYGRCIKVFENSKVRMSRYLDTCTKTQMAKIMVQHGTPSRSSWAKSVQSSVDKPVMGKALRESSIRTRLGESSKLGMLICKLTKRTILVCVCPNVGSTCERSQFGRTNILRWPRLFGLHSTRMRNEQRYCGQLQKCLNPVSLEELKKSCLVQRNLTQTSTHGPMIRKVMQSYVLSDIAS